MDLSFRTDFIKTRRRAYVFLAARKTNEGDGARKLLQVHARDDPKRLEVL
jgi:hypothetical protein